MRPPFPGMDPWLEHPALWPDVHNRLIAAIADDLTPRLAPRYYLGLEQRTYLVTPAKDEFIGIPDMLIGPVAPWAGGRAAAPDEVAGVDVLDVELPVPDEAREWYLEVREAGKARGRLVTVIELLSPANKRPGRGRRKYLAKRNRVLESTASLIEIDLLRDGEPLPPAGPLPRTAYRVLIRRGTRPDRAKLYRFGPRVPIPTLPVPLLPGDDEPALDLNAILHALYDRARFDLRIDYRTPPVPPLADADVGWAREVVGA